MIMDDASSCGAHILAVVGCGAMSVPSPRPAAISAKNQMDVAMPW
jgi:hypothetical protein